MSRPRTYIGPFGRILPVPDGSEPEREYLPCDETRTNMTTFSLPPPDRLQFGSDASPGFTDPTRYNTTTQSSRTDEPTNAIYKEISRQAHHEHLPSLRHILTPTSQSSIAQYPPQQSPSHVQQRSTFFSDHRGMVPDLHIRHPWYSPYQASFPQSQLPTQAQLVENLNPQRDDYQSSLSTQHFPSSYASLSQGPVQLPYPSQPQQIAVPNVLLPQQLLPVDQPQQPQILPVNSPVQYYPDHRGSHDTVLNPGSGPEQGEASIANHVKPLPRVTGEGDIPGEGPSWFYEDGTSCKKMIDGEPVNAQWGVRGLFVVNSSLIPPCWEL